MTVAGAVGVFAEPVDGDGGAAGRPEIVTDPAEAAVVTAGAGTGAVTETVATGVATVTAVVDSVVGALRTVVGRGGTVVGTSVGNPGTVTVVSSGLPLARPFATKKPHTPTQTSMTTVLRFTPSSPRHTTAERGPASTFTRFGNKRRRDRREHVFPSGGWAEDRP